MYVYYSLYDDEGERCSNSTRIKVAKIGDIKSVAKHEQNKLNLAVSAIDKHIGMLRKADLPVLKEEIEPVIKDALGIKKIINRKTVGDIIESYLKGAENGTILNPKTKKKYSPSWCKTTKHAYSKCIKEGKLVKKNIEQVRPIHFTSLQSWLVSNDLSSNSISTYNNLIVSILRNSKKLGWHGNKAIFEEALHLKGEDVDYPIVYSVDEIQVLMDHTYNEHYSKVRDVFVFGCFMFLRYIDYYQTDYTKSIYNDSVIYQAEKTDGRVEVPLHPIAKNILDKYDNKLPKIGYSHLKDYVKEMARLAGFNQKVLFSRTQGGVTIKEHKEKWQLTTTHTMRRTAATNAVLSGMSIPAVMKLGGWGTEKSFLRYIKASSEDIANMVRKSAFYAVKSNISEHEHSEYIKQAYTNGLITKLEKEALEKCIEAGMDLSFNNGIFSIKLTTTNS